MEIKSDVIYLQNCKDISLESTIEDIQNILQKNNIEIIEKTVEGASGVFSTRLTIISINMGTNGKGTSVEMSRASAYGELMERLQNFALYKFNCSVINDLDYEGFLYSFDEEYVPYTMLENMCLVFGNSFGADFEKAKGLLSERERDKGMLCVTPFIELFKAEKVMIPSFVTEHIYATNGMAAGNTLEEALVQGLSEILERYANKKIIMEDVIPPIIPTEKLRLTKNAKMVIENITQKGNYIFEFRDCSMGEGIPVVQMIFIDQSLGKYFVKFGCHPILEIAIERTLTELFQGRNLLTSPLWLQDFTYSDIEEKEHNFDKIYRSGDGQYPYKSFGDVSSYPYEDCWYQGDDKSNRCLFNFMLRIVKRNNWRLLYKNMSYLGFATVHILIPEISNVIVFDDEYIDRITWFRECRKDVRDIVSCNKQQKSNVVSFLSCMHYSTSDSISNLYELPITSDSVLFNFNVEYFKYILLSTMGKPKQALVALDIYINDNGYKSSKNGSLLKCEREVFYAIKIKNESLEGVKKVIQKLYGKEKAMKAIDKVQNHKKILENLSFLCSHRNGCSLCEMSDQCNYHQVKEFHNKIVNICKEGWYNTNEQVSISTDNW